jgi:peptide chain release factor 1
VPVLERELQLMLLPRDAADERSAILEVRPAAGGDEAALFAAELFRAYQRYAEGKRWRFEVLEYDESDLGGVRGAVAEIGGQGVFARLKFESGVHRVQRVPGHRDAGAHPHLHRHRRGAAAGGGGGRADQRGRPPHRHLPARPAPAGST